MGLLGSSLAALAFMVNQALTNIYGNNVKWQLSSGDQISFPLYRYFETNRDYTIKYRAITTFTTKIISRDPVLTKEVAQGCKAISAMDKTEKEADNKLTMICNKNEVYESSIDGQSGKVTNTNLIYKFDGMECLALEWSKSLNAYGVFCIQVEASKAADSQFYIVNIIDRATLKLVGSSKVAFSGLNSYEFNGRIKIKFREVTKGTGTATVVLVFDESFTDNNVNIASKGNDFFLVTEIDTNTKKPAAAIQFVKFNSITTILKGEVFKSLTMEIYSNFLLLAFYSKSNLVKVARCSFTYATTEMAISGCILREHPIDLGYGLISFLNSDLVAYYNKRDAKFFTCKLYPNDQDTTQQIIKDCNAFEGRKGTDIDIKDFYAINDKNLKVYYMTKETKIDLGVDVYELGAADPKVKLLDSFNTYCSLSTDVKSNYYTITDSFLDVFTKTRTEELLIQGSLVPQDKSNLVTIEKDHQGAISIKEIEVSQFPKFITAIQAKTNFPTLIGFLGTYFRIPIGRAYFSGNGINFELTGQLSTRIVSNAGDFQFKVDGENTADILAYHHTSGYAAMFMKNSRLLIVNCQKVIEGGLIALKCERIGERVDLRSEFNEQILATYHTPHMLIIVTTYGQFIFFNKVRQTSLLQNVQSGTRFFKQVSFKPKDAYILISVLATDSKGQNPEIQNYRLDEFSKLDSTSTDAFGYVSTITKDSYKAESNQETAGDFCPKSIDYELTDAPVLDVLNACATKDRRLLRFSMKDEEKPAQLSNTFIRLAELRNDKIQMCADLDTAIIASIDSPQAIGIGYESYNIQQNLGLKALNVEKVTKIVCLGQRAYALGLLTSDKKFKIATYFTRKLKYANERLHSLLEFSAEDGYKDFSGAESDGTIFYNIYSPGKPTLFRMVDLDGPELYVKSISRTQISDSAIACSNGESNALLPLPLSFKQQKQSVQVSSRNRSIEITKKKYDFGELCNVQGPVFDYKLDSEVTALTITPRVSTAAEFIPTADTSALKSLYFSRIKVIRDITFILSQMPGKSQILAKFEENQKPKVLNFILNQTCHNFDIVEETNSAIGFLVALNCFYNNEKRIHFVSLTLDGKHIYQGFSSVVLTSLDMAFTFSTTAIPTSYRYLFSNIDESNHLTIYSFNLSTSLDKLNAQISFSSIVHEVANGSLVLPSDSDEDHPNPQEDQRYVLHAQRP